MQSGLEATVKAAPPGREVGAEEDRVAEPQPRGPQPVPGRVQRCEGGEQQLHHRLGPRLARRLSAQEDLRLEQLAGVAQLCVQRLADHAALVQLGRVDGTAPAPFVAQQLRQAAPLAVAALGLSLEAAPQTRGAAARGGQEVDADPGPLAALGLERGHRRGEGLQGIGGELEPAQRINARVGEDELGAQLHPLYLRPAGQHVGGVAEFDPLVGAQGGAYQLLGALRELQQVDESALVVVDEPDAQGAGRAVEPAAQAQVRARELGADAQHGLEVGLELIGGHHGRDGSPAKRAPSREEALWSQRRGDSDCAESEGRERERGGPSAVEQSGGVDARYRAPDREQHEEGEDDEHQSRVVRIALGHAPTSG